MELKGVWDLPDYIEKNVSKSELHRFKMKLGNFSSGFCTDGLQSYDIVAVKEKLNNISDRDLGVQFLNKMIHPKYEKNFLDLEKLSDGSDFHEDLGFVIRGRIPFSYVKWYTKNHDSSPSKIDYEDVIRIWGDDDSNDIKLDWI